ncbi:MAG: polysaccharide deacetylase family protein [Deltaproteobacteria bacterium]|nr:polysaccharide deacetylase family protein [Deltaproteobacteria bacterium]
MFKEISIYLFMFSALLFWGCSGAGSSSSEGGTDSNNIFDTNSDNYKDSDNSTGTDTFIGSDDPDSDSDSNTDSNNYVIGMPDTDPPMGLKPDEVPLFIVIGSDDNAHAGLDTNTGMGFLLNLYNDRVNPAGNGNSATFDGEAIHFSAYGNGVYIQESSADPVALVKESWRTVFDNGNELGNHTYSHEHGTLFSYDDWYNEIKACTDEIIKPYTPGSLNLSSTGIGIDASEIVGFRSPYLEYNDNLFDVLSDLDFKYDCSIEEGYENGQDGTNFYWPYKLDNGSPVNSSISSHAGLWEIPVYPFVAPPDDKCLSYGVPSGLREKLAANPGYLDNALDNIYLNKDDGRLRGLDYDVWNDYDMEKEEALAVFKHTLDQRLKGNMAPMTMCMHVALYSEHSWGNIQNTSYQERIQVVTDFINYALTKPNVRIVSAKQMLTWLESPTPL